MIRLMRLAAAAGLVTGLLAACATPEPRAVFSPMVFDDLAPVGVAAEALDVQTAFTSSRQSPNVEHLAPVAYLDAVRTWANQRLRPNGSSVNVIKVTVDSATIIERRLDVAGGVRGAFQKDQAFEYEAELRVSVALVSPMGEPGPVAEARAWRKRSLPEGATDIDRQRLYYELVEATVRDMDRELIPRLRTAFGSAVVN